MVGTGHRGTSMWGAELLERHPDVIEFVGLCDINPLRAKAAQKLIGVSIAARRSGAEKRPIHIADLVKL